MTRWTELVNVALRDRGREVTYRPFGAKVTLYVIVPSTPGNSGVGQVKLRLPNWNPTSAGESPPDPLSRPSLVPLREDSPWVAPLPSVGSTCRRGVGSGSGRRAFEGGLGREGRAFGSFAGRGSGSGRGGVARGRGGGCTGVAAGGVGRGVSRDCRGSDGAPASAR